MYKSASDVLYNMLRKYIFIDCGRMYAIVSICIQV